MIAVYLLVGLALGALVGALIGRSLAKKSSAVAEKAAEGQAAQILDAARAEADSMKKDAHVQGKELAFKLKSGLDKGAHTVSVRAVDSADNIGVSSVNFSVP